MRPKVYISKEKVVPGDLLDAYDTAVFPSTFRDSSWFVFIDLEPEANWAHLYKRGEFVECPKCGADVDVPMLTAPLINGSEDEDAGDD